MPAVEPRFRFCGSGPRRTPCHGRATFALATTLNAVAYFGSRLHWFGMNPPPKRFASTTIGWSEVTRMVNATFGAGSGAPLGIVHCMCLVAFADNVTVVAVSPG